MKQKLDRFVGVCSRCKSHYTLGVEGDNDVCDLCIADGQIDDETDAIDTAFLLEGVRGESDGYGAED